LRWRQQKTFLAGLKGDFVKVGFALETGDVVEQAREKLERKGLDLIVANGPESFESDFIKATLISHDSVEDLP